MQSFKMRKNMIISMTGKLSQVLSLPITQTERIL